MYIDKINYEIPIGEGEGSHVSVKMIIMTDPFLLTILFTEQIVSAQGGKWER